MVTLNVYTIRELLYTPAIKGNQTTLARLLKINRGTLAKYMVDIDNTRHIVILQDDKYILMSTTNPRPRKGAK